LQIWVLCNTMSEGQDRKVVSEVAIVVVEVGKRCGRRKNLQGRKVEVDACGRKEHEPLGGNWQSLEWVPGIDTRLSATLAWVEVNKEGLTSGGIGI
jgi:hypothetical protein